MTQPRIKDIYRTIEKVITYNVSQEDRLRSEITEYIVTESIEEQFEQLLTKMQTAMDLGGENEVGVWVSGFYGSARARSPSTSGLRWTPRAGSRGSRFLTGSASAFPLKVFKGIHAG